MAVNSASNRVDAVGTGAQVAFPYTFNVYTASDLQVYVAGVLQTINTNYTLSAVNVPGGITGGTVTFTSAPANGAAVLLLRVLPYTQATQFTNLDKFDAKSAVEGSFDKGVMQTQQLVEQIGRAVTIPATSLLHPVLMPDPTIATNFGAALKIKGDGTGIDTFSVSNTPFSSTITTKGDIAVFGSAIDRLPVGADNTILVADSAQPRGLRWAVSLVLAGLLDISNALAGQIKFPVSANLSADANTLDDYEEGTWTPTITFGGNSVGVTYTTQLGRYTKIGRLVTIEFNIILTSKGSSVGAANIRNLPFTINNNATGTCSLYWNSLTTSSVILQGFGQGGTNSLAIYGLGAAGASLIVYQDTNFANATQLAGVFTYSV